MLIVMLRFANQMLGGDFNVFLIFPGGYVPGYILIYGSDRERVVSSRRFLA